ncbi:MAG: glycosyltransferase family A protein [Bacteroidota bacterium]
MNRLFHLKHTYLQNILDNLDYGKVEFVLINYNSQDKLDEWVKEKLSKYIDSGLLNYYKTLQPSVFHASIAKNLAHRLANGEVLCNLDGDNYTGKDFAYYINYLLNKNEVNSLLHFRKEPYWGTEGRIVLRSDDFHRLGGYDEELLPIGHEDHDLLNRARASGIKYINVTVENFLKYLSNTTKEKAENCTEEGKDYYELEQANKKRSDHNIANGMLVANQSEGFNKIEVFHNFSSEKITIN